MTQTLRAHQYALEELWQQGVSGTELIRRYSDLADAYIIKTFQQAIDELQPKGQIALLALGGYGRRELYPYSDIDLLLVHDGRSRKWIKEVAEKLLYPLWDAGFDVGHSVRTVKGAIAFAKEDFVFQVALLDARLMAGSQELFDELYTRYVKKLLEGRRSQFVTTMEQFRAERRGKYGSHAYLLEPHIKEGKGGMRDIQAMFWVAKGVFGLQDVDAIESSGMISAEDKASFDVSYNMLVKIRNHLHYLRRRKDDQLVFEYQEEMAQSFGYLDQDGMRSVEHFMRDVYSHLQTIAVVTDLFFEHVQEILGLANQGSKEKKLERSIVLRGGRIRLTNTEDIKAKPYILMRLFLQSGRMEVPLHHTARRAVTEHLYLVDDGFRKSKRVAGIFSEILVESGNIFQVLEAMLVTGLLTAYLPEFSGIESLAQHDLYHLYTVDRHQLQAVAEVHRLKEEFADVYHELEQPELLYLAALLHDIGKGKQTDHSERGAAMIEVIGRRLKLTSQQCAVLAFVVRYHLFLPENAMRRDLSDQKFIHQTADLIGDVNKLAMLYLLTVADSRATGPSAWSSWKASLLSEFYLQIKTCLEAECHLQVLPENTTHQGVAWLRDQLYDQLSGSDSPRMDVDLLPDDYLLSFTPEIILNHLRIHREQDHRLQQQVLLFPSAGMHSWSLLLMSRDRSGLLAKFFGVLALHNLKVLAAQIFTWPDGTVVDVLEVTSTVGGDFEEQDWKKLEIDCNKAINYRLDIGSQLHSKMPPIGMAPSRQVQQLERKVLIDNKTSDKYTIIEVHGGDEYGTLYQLAQTMSDFSLDIHRARVATEVEQLIDVFYVTVSSGQKLLDPALIRRVEHTLMDVVGIDRKDSIQAA
ncbi:[protein-PII] uridylyltransferase [Desulfogranum japonicum]|uniref:[protein-PII] uridylyltransferase n=1 Tax=Desulfogranum japonicum TaxID=231447 RepID=UPI00041CF8EB|nr:[protein-PII] uridylyltransferase [Desulfogranum japonicum]